MRNSVLALHCGDTHNLDFFVSQLALINEHLREPENSFKDALWARLRGQSQRLLISEALNRQEACDLEEFDTYYCDFIDEDSLKAIKSKYSKGLEFMDVDSVFKEAQSKSRTTNISELEAVQWAILKAAFKSSSPDQRGINVWSEVMNVMQGILNNLRASVQNNAFEKEKFDIKYSIILRVFAHLAMLLLVTGRVSDSGMTAYNSILQDFISHLVS